MTRLARFVFRYRASRRTRRAARRRARGALSTACCRATRCPPRRRVNLRLYCIMSDEASVLSGTQNLSKPPRLKCHARFLPHKHPKPAQYRALHRYALANQRHIKHLCCTHTPPLLTSREGPRAHTSIPPPHPPPTYPPNRAGARMGGYV